MNTQQLKRAFYSQKAGAKHRGIGWELTFDQWLAWWGDDIERRGHGHGKLHMQRVADSGPYALDNIRKGTQRENTKTRYTVARNRQSEADAAAFREYLKRQRDQDDGEDDRPEHNSLGCPTMFGIIRRFRGLGCRMMAAFSISGAGK